MIHPLNFTRLKGNFRLIISTGPILYLRSRNSHVRWVPCHHGMARPQVADGGDGLQIWRVAANILNKQSRKADRGGPPSWGLGVEVTTHHLNK
jgi:hypothetical protein